MFERYFGFSENPFKIDLDLSYLVLGKHQEEVIAHLRYAVIEGEGFIAITGERGVGKTLLCHSFIDNLGENTLAAYINNPVGSAEELLKEINEQFKTLQKVRPDQELTDALNAFLMQARMQGKKAVVFIDDAHLLKNDSLEQVRLISNLETARHKLIQIVLVGEPKLTEMLASHELRQIGQRVSVRYHIPPLSLSETISYIDYRMSIASKGSPVIFEPKACQRIYKYSKGNPRAINTVCYQALLKAFQQKEQRVTGRIAEEAVHHLRGSYETHRPGYLSSRTIGWMAVGCCILFAVAVGVHYFQADRPQAPEEQSPPQKGEIDNGGRLEAFATPFEMMPPGIEPDPRTEEMKAPQERSGSVPSQTQPADQALEAEQPGSSEMTHSVQVGAFLKLDHAKSLVSQLQSRGHLAQIVPVQDSRGRSWHTVRIGDYPSEREALAKAAEFRELEKMDTAVRPFNKL